MTMHSCLGSFRAGAFFVVLSALSPPAKAERIRPWQVSAGLGASGATEHASQASFALFGGGFYSTDREGSAARAFAALGASLFVGRAYAPGDDARKAGYFAVGPEARAGFAFGDPARKKFPPNVSLLYLSATPFYGKTPGRATWITESDGAFGVRTKFGAAMLDSWLFLEWFEDSKSGGCEGGLCGLALLPLLLPNTIEFGYERAGGSNRSTLFVGYTF
jgi:hypothetical protein